MFSRAWAKPWCKRFRWPKQRGFNLVEYGERVANVLAREWAFRGDYFYWLWDVAGRDASFRYTAEHIEAYIPDEEFLEWERDVAVADELYDLILEVQRMAPTNP